MLGLGTVMYFATRVGITPAPVVLGIILGPIAETNYAQGKLIAEVGVGMVTYFFGGALNLFLIGLCVVSVGYGVFAELRLFRRRRSGS